MDWIKEKGFVLEINCVDWNKEKGFVLEIISLDWILDYLKLRLFPIF